MWEGGYGGGGKRETIYLSLHCHHQNDSCIKMGVMRAVFNVLLIVKDKVTRLFTDYNFSRERRAEVDSNRCPSAYQPNALPLGHTGSRLALFFSVRSVLLYVHRDRTHYN